MAHVVVGTAGHIDHGKSSLVRALTGTDPDRLPEEKRRQITIDLGYAFLDDVAAIIDVPGHEKFIHNMVAGASTVDFALLVVAADDGVMPQTTEHLHILNLLGITRGAIVLTKISLTEPNWRALVKEQIREAVATTFLRDAPLFEVDSLSQEGIPELRAFLVKTLAETPQRIDRGCFRLAIDRVFSMHGHGTVATGTILSGMVSAGAKLATYPANFPARVKQLQTHGLTATQLQPGMRAALNLHCDEEPQRGQTLADPESLIPTTHLLASFKPIPGAPALKDRQRVRFLITTQEVMGRVRFIESTPQQAFLSIQFDEPVVAAWGDHFILRRYSPLNTLGGGRVLDPHPPRITSKNRLTEKDAATTLDVVPLAEAVEHWIIARCAAGIKMTQVAQTFGIPQHSVERIVNAKKAVFVRLDEFVATNIVLSEWKRLVISHLDTLHKKSPETPAFSLGQLQRAAPHLHPTLLDHVVEQLLTESKLVKRGALFARAEVEAAIPDPVRKLMQNIAQRLKSEGFAPPSAGALAEELKKPKSEIERALVLLDKQGSTFRLGNDIFFDRSAFEAAIARTKMMLESGSVQVSDLSKALQSSRKYVVPFLEYLDTLGITERRENLRVPGRNFNN